MSRPDTPSETPLPESGDDSFVLPSATLNQRPGDTIGPYKLLERLGEGGFGVVYLAEQREPVKRRVALKIIKLGMDTEQVVARFKSERQALALMDHPNIAKIFDAGATSSGRPYFVMERIKGVPITAYCDQHGLGIDQRLKLFTDVCQAIQHAHQKGVIHRDIKPSNILVTLQGGEPFVKIIDFGVAKATQFNLTDQTLVTQAQQVIGTPAYMSPEQAEMGGLDIDTRSDVYSLGILLYELLTGTVPLDPRALKSASSDEIRESVRNHEVIRPSLRFLRLPLAERNSIAKRRGLSANLIAKKIRGDLDWIVIKALEKDRTRRYETSSAFARDVQHFLAQEPVSAAAPSRLYTLHRMVQRNRTAFAVATLFALTFATGLVTSLWGLLDARKSRDAYRTVNHQLHEELKIKEAARNEISRLLEEAKHQQIVLQQRAYRSQISQATRAWERHEWLDLHQLLEDTPADLRGWEWYRLSALNPLRHRLLRPSSNSKVFVHSYAISPNRRYIATGDLLASRSEFPIPEDGKIKMWNTRTGRLVWEAPGIVNVKKCEGAFSPDNSRVVFGVDGNKVKVWDVDSGNLIWSRQLGSYEAIVSTYFDPKGRWIAVGGQKVGGTSDPASVTFLHADTGEPDFDLGNEHDVDLTDGEFTPDGNYFVLFGGGKTRNAYLSVWDLRSKTRIRSLDLPDPRVGVVDIAMASDQERMLVARLDGSIILWDTSSDPTSWKSIEVYQTPRLVRSVSFDALGDHFAAVSVSPNSSQLSYWQVGQTTRAKATLEVHASWVWQTRYDAERDVFLVCADNGAVDGWDLQSQASSRKLAGNVGYVRTLTFSPDSLRLATGSNDGGIRVFDTRSDQAILPPIYEHRFPAHLSFNTEGTRLASAGYIDRNLKLWDIATGRALNIQNSRRPSPLRAIAFSRNESGELMATLEDNGAVFLWNTNSGANQDPLIPAGSGIVSLDFLTKPGSPQLVTCTPGGSGNVKLWDTHSGDLIRTMPGRGDFIDIHTISEDADRVAVRTPSQVFLWNLNNDTTTLVETGAATAADFTPDGTRLATVHAGDIKLWEPNTGILVATLSVPDSEHVTDIRFSPDGEFLAIATDSGSVILWPNTREALPKIHSIEDPQMVPVKDGDRNSPNPFELNRISWEIVEHSDRSESDYRRALRNVESALLRLPDRYYLLRTKGLALYRLGNYEHALDTLTQSRERHRAAGREASLGYADLHAGLALALFRLNQVEAAHESLGIASEVIRNSYDPRIPILAKEAAALLK